MDDGIVADGEEGFEWGGRRRCEVVGDKERMRVKVMSIAERFPKGWLN